MTLLHVSHDKHVLWRKTAGDWLARDLGLYDEHAAPYWILEDLPHDYALFEQVTHPKAERSSTGKIRLDRFIFGHDGRKIRSAISLGKHISWVLHGSIGSCTCDGCKVVTKPGAGGSASVSNAHSTTTTPRRTSPVVAASAATQQFAGSPLSNAVTNAALGPTHAASTSLQGPAIVEALHTAATTSPKSRKKRARSSEDDDDDARSEGASADDVSSEHVHTPTVHQPPVGPKRGRPRTSSNATDPKNMLPVIRRAKAASRRGWDYDSDDCGSSLGLSGLEDHDDGDMCDATVGGRAARNTLQPAGDAAPIVPKVNSPATTSLLYMLQDTSARQRADLSEPCWRRTGELVWCRMPQQLAQVDTALQRRLTHWPAIVTARNDTSAVPTYNVSLLAISERDLLVNVHADDVLPWLGFVPHELSHYDVTQSVQAARLRFGYQLSSRVDLSEVVAGGRLIVTAIWFAACEAGRQMASIHVLSPARVNNGAHLSPAAAPAADSPIRALYVPRQSVRTMSFSHVFYGPELVHAGDFVRLASRIDLPAGVASLVTNKSPWTVHTSLILQIAAFVKQVGRESAPLVRGKVFEMVPTGVQSPASLVGGGLSNDEDESASLSGAVVAAVPVPTAYPGHMMRCLTACPSSFVDLPLDSIAGRYYPLAQSMQHDLTIVDDIVERARTTGLAGEVGVRPVSLLLGGLVTGAGVPQTNAPDNLALLESATQKLPQDEERLMDLELRERIRISDEQGLIASGLLASSSGEFDTGSQRVQFEPRIQSPTGLPVPSSALLTYPQAHPPPSFVPYSVPAYPSPLTPGQMHWSPLPSYGKGDIHRSPPQAPGMYPFPYIAAAGAALPTHMLPPPMLSTTQLPSVVVRAWA
ncbi:hypothetical protein ACM66B_003885 [Microbotryomycetes sp. NB124-2]